MIYKIKHNLKIYYKKKYNDIIINNNNDLFFGIINNK